MNRYLKKGLVIVFSLLAFGCATTDRMEKNDATVNQEVSIEDRIYYLQHRLMPKWLFQSEGVFFSDMKTGKVSQLYDIASEVVTPDYANEIIIKPLDGENAVLITFPTPLSPTNCYFVLLKETEAGFYYYTYEKTIDFGDDSSIGVVGSWDSEGDHHNYGDRGYDSEFEFIQDVLSL